MGDIISFSVSRDGESEKQEEFVISNTMTCQCQPVTKIESLYLAVNVTRYNIGLLLIVFSVENDVNVLLLRPYNLPHSPFSRARLSGRMRGWAR